MRLTAPMLARDWHLHEVPPRTSLVPWKTYPGLACPHGREIVLVNGSYVRNRYDSDFSQGGNGYRYRFVPKGELWVDEQISEIEHPLILLHECVETELMKAGLDYDQAHDRAKRLEDKVRRGGLR